MSAVKKISDELINRYRLLSGSNKVLLWTLQLWILIVSIGPRIQIAALPGDLRIQDFLFLPLVAFAAAAQIILLFRNKRLTKEFIALTLYVLTGFVAIGIAIARGESPEEVVLRLGVTFRVLEPIGIGILAFIAFSRLRNFGRAVSGLSIGLGFFLNYSWLVWSAFFGVRESFWSFTSKTPSVYGATLLGEPGVFPSGQYLVLVGVLFISLFMVIRPGLSKWPLLLIASLAASGIVLVNSRTSIVGILVAVVLLIVRFAIGAKSTFLKAATLFSAVALAGSVALLIPRLRLEPVLHAIEHRMAIVYLPILGFAKENFFFGGGIGYARFLTQAETHNLYFFLLADLGVIGLSLFFLLVVFWLRVLVRALRQNLPVLSSAWLFASLFLSLSTLIAGTVQDSNLPVIYMHLAAIIWGGSMSSSAFCSAAKAEAVAFTDAFFRLRAQLEKRSF